MNDIIEILIKSLSGGWDGSVGPAEILISICFASLVAMYIYMVYALFTKKTFYSRDFNITLVGVTIITSGLVASIQTSLLVTLSVGGALSIIRFRTAIKSPIDLMFLFWCIAAGIMCGTGVALYALMLSVFLTLAVIVLSKLPIIKAPEILIINAKSDVDVDLLIKTISEHAKNYAIKSRSISADSTDMTIEFRSKEGNKNIVEEIAKIEGVESASVLEHNGDIVF